MKYYQLLLLAILYFENISTPYAQDVKVKSDIEIVKLVFAFANEAYGTKGDFLLDSPRNVFVNDKNDIIVFDKYNIKVYDSKGNGEKIIGGKGQGPGEFNSNPHMVAASPAEYFTVLETGYYSIFDNNLKFIDKRRFINDRGFLELLKINNFKPEDTGTPNYMYAYGEKEKIYRIGIRSKPYLKVAILYDQGGKVKPILYKDNKNTYYEDPFMEIPDGMLGAVFFVPLPGKMVAYADNYEEEYGDGKKGIYKIHIVSIDDLSERIITKEFIPEKADRTSYLEQLRKSAGTNKMEIKRYEMQEAEIKKKIYRRQINNMNNDSIYVFILKGFTDKSYFVYDVFNTLNGKHLSTFIYEGAPQYIKNGYVYSIDRNKNGYNEIRVYKLDPSIYGKK